MDNVPRLLTAGEACKSLCISRRTLYTLTKDGRLKSVNIGPHCQRWDVRDLDAFIAGCKNSRPLPIKEILPDVLDKIGVER